MATFVLVHGANVGGWCWRLITPRLRAAGHQAYAPSLTGHGDRVHLLTPEVGMETYVQDLCNLLFYEDLDNVVLVGHSNGGGPAAVVADRMPQRIAHVVYLDAFVPLDGETLWGLIPEPARHWMERQLAAQPENWKAAAAPVESWVEMGRLEGWSPVIARWAGERATPQPLKPSKDAIHLKGGEAVEKLPKTFIRCTESQAMGLDAAVRRARELGMDVVDIETGHMPMFSHPDLLIEVLLRIAEPYGL